MDISITIARPTYATENQVDMYYSIATNTGILLDGLAPIDFASSATQTNNAIINHAKQLLLTERGYTVINNDRIKLFGGSV